MASWQQARGTLLYRRDWETQGEKRETASGIQTQASGIQTQRDREARPCGPCGQRRAAVTLRGCVSCLSPSLCGQMPDAVTPAPTAETRQVGDRSQQHRETSGRHEATVTASGIRPQRLEDTGRRDWETQGDKRETRPRSRRQHLASDRRDYRRHRETSRRDRETQGQAGDPGASVRAGQRLGDKRQSAAASVTATQRDTSPASQATRPRSRRQHLASDCRDWETQRASGKHDQSRVTASGL